MIEAIKEALSDQCYNIRTFAEDRLTTTGLKSEDCQLTAIKLKLKELEALISGIESTDVYVSEEFAGELVTIRYSRNVHASVDMTTTYAVRKDDYDNAMSVYDTLEEAFEEELRSKAQSIYFEEVAGETFQTFEREYEEV